jgi:two-component system NtrC family sensor kinase
MAIAVAALCVPRPDELLEAVLELNRTVTVDMHADEIVYEHVQRMRTLFVGRFFCVRLLSRDGAELGTVYATGRLRSDRRDHIALTRDALKLHGLSAPHPAASAIAITDRYEPVFVHGERGFDVPLADGNVIAGIMSVEYPDDTQIPADDRALIVQLSLQLSSALRNARLHRESVYLRDYLGKLLDHANVPIMVMGRGGEVTLANRAFLTVTGMKREEIIGHDWLSLLPEPERRRLLPVYINAMRGEPSTNFEAKLPRRDGSAAQVAVNAASILSPDGDIEGVIYIYRDVTELRELEEQIIHAEKLATLGQLAAGVVHELNNPLTSISVYGDYLLQKATRESAPAGDIEKLKRIVESAQRILNFTRDLVTYARPSTERPVPTDVHELLDQALGYCEHLIEETAAKVERQFDVSLPPVYGVRGQLVQVFVNLITNACHAMPLGAGQLRIATEPAGDGRLAVRVTDNGRGIPEQHLQRVFEPFFTTKGEGKGTGLGLSIVKNIVEQHRGAINVQSEVGRGTVFGIELACRPDPRET